MTGNKNKLKTNAGVMDSYLQKEQKEQTVTPAHNKRQSNVLSPLEDERSKTKKKNPKTSNGDKESDHAGENSEKIKGKKTRKNRVMNQFKELLTPVCQLLPVKLKKKQIMDRKI